MGDDDVFVEEVEDSDLARCLPFDVEAWDFGWERVEGATFSSFELSWSDNDELLSCRAFSDDRLCAWRLVVGICVLMESFPN